MAEEIDIDSLPEASYQTAESSRILAELDRKTQERKIAVPTNDLQVRKRLRELGHPITLFAERKEDRRERLRSVYAELNLVDGQAESESESESEPDEEFYTEGTTSLLEARQNIAEYSLPRAKKRVARERLESSLPIARILDLRKDIYNELRTFTTLGAQVGDRRSISSVAFSPDSNYLLTGSWSGSAKLWDVPGCNCLHTFAGHGDDMRVGGVAWHPQATLGLSPDAANLATASEDCTVCLWSLSGLTSNKVSTSPLHKLQGHTGRVCKTKFHPSGKYLGSTSFDGTWRLWDVETGAPLLEQEGHSKEVYTLAFQDDGALVCSGGLDAIGRVWDLRSGRTVMVLDGHVQDILGMDFSPNGHQIATGSNDDSIRIWEMRSLECIYTIPAHRSTVSDVKFYRSRDNSFPYTINNNKQTSSSTTENKAETDMDVDKNNDDDEKQEQQNTIEPSVSGTFLASSSFDGTVKMWSADDWQLIKALESEAGGRITSVDIASNGKFLASGESQRSFKLWAAENVSL